MKKPHNGFDYFVPLVDWLGSEDSQVVSGRLFEVEGGKLSIADGWRKGPECDKGGCWQVEEIDAAVEQLIAEAVPAQKVYGY